jgi:hypothetical protein
MRLAACLIQRCNIRGDIDSFVRQVEVFLS